MTTGDLELTVTPLSPPTAAPPREAPTAAPRPRWFWPATAIITLAGAALRLLWLDRPFAAIFDEQIYAPQALSLRQHGVEWDPQRNTAALAIEPPLGKWLIAAGEQAFGYTPFGWRISAAVAGTLCILLVILIARRLLGSPVLACAAGALMALDGLHLVLSRTALLDIFLLLFVLAGFGCVVRHGERRTRAIPWWLLAAGLCVGLATAVKWSGAWFLIAYGVLLLTGDATAHRAAGTPAPWRHAVRGTGPWLAGGLAVAAGAYLAAWTGWFTAGGSLSGLLRRHQEIWQFWTSGDTSTHPYASSPLQWLLLGRPVAFSFTCADDPCGPTSRVAEVLLLGTPLLWWAFLPALVVLGWLAVTRTDRRAIALLLCALTGIVPWLRPDGAGPPTFLFYAAPAEPFLVLAVVYALHVLSRRFVNPAIVIGVYVAAVAACFAYFYPVFAGWPLTHEDWLARMWLGTRWI